MNSHLVIGELPSFPFIGGTYEFPVYLLDTMGYLKEYVHSNY
jgi:hypothetical protein